MTLDLRTITARALALDAGAHNPDDVVPSIMPRLGVVDTEVYVCDDHGRALFDAHGTPLDLRTVVDPIKRERPYLFRPSEEETTMPPFAAVARVSELSAHLADLHDPAYIERAAGEALVALRDPTNPTLRLLPNARAEAEETLLDEIRAGLVAEAEHTLFDLHEAIPLAQRELAAAVDAASDLADDRTLLIERRTLSGLTLEQELLIDVRAELQHTRVRGDLRGLTPRALADRYERALAVEDHAAIRVIESSYQSLVTASTEAKEATALHALGKRIAQVRAARVEERLPGIAEHQQAVEAAAQAYQRIRDVRGLRPRARRPEAPVAAGAGR